MNLCAEASENSFFAVCLNPVFIPLAKAELAGSDVKVATVCGFPLGAVSSEQKAVEARLSVEAGTDEVERVVHIGAALERDWEAVEADVRAVRRAIPDAALKVITLTCFLLGGQKREATAASVRAGAEFMKTSTGFGTGGATLDDVRRLRGTEVCFMNGLSARWVVVGSLRVRGMLSAVFRYGALPDSGGAGLCTSMGG
ncbi:deoxyribose-phosphate aldolase [Deinococcus seoulensis]|uniref:Deoxyribose-phosphate aldolase n=1 Tax=Deinococcus seoulensis TaxID=1837379 RepID=A0ABQ2RTF0_9DEIO|nr:deoxyribose-phosphate aldolase [Deinococcus seoulensis]